MSGSFPLQFIVCVVWKESGPDIVLEEEGDTEGMAKYIVDEECYTMAKTQDMNYELNLWKSNNFIRIYTVRKISVLDWGIHWYVESKTILDTDASGVQWDLTACLISGMKVYWSIGHSSIHISRCWSNGSPKSA